MQHLLALGVSGVELELGGSVSHKSLGMGVLVALKVVVEGLPSPLA